MAKFMVVCKLETTVVVEAGSPSEAIDRWGQLQEEGLLTLDHYVIDQDEPYTIQVDNQTKETISV
jgi:hypothetical protein